MGTEIFQLQSPRPFKATKYCMWGQGYLPCISPHHLDLSSVAHGKLYREATREQWSRSWFLKANCLDSSLWFCPLLVMLPWASYLTFLQFSFCNCTLGIIIASPLMVAVMIKWKKNGWYTDKIQ